METFVNRGYLHENYRLFHSADQRDLDFQTHSHDFHKIVFCLSGHVTYIMEGTTYFLSPWDMLIIPRHQIHRSILSSSEVYERIILWINDPFLRRYEEPVLTQVFSWTRADRTRLFRADEKNRSVLMEKLMNLEQNQNASYPGHTLLADTYLLQFLVRLNTMLDAQNTPADSAVRSDPKLNEVLDFINRNLTQDLSIERITGRFFISPSYLMHEFKRFTGCTVHQYIQQKRLILASSKIQQGEMVVSAALQSGFSDYSAFLKAFRKQYGCSPSSIRQP